MRGHRGFRMIAPYGHGHMHHGPHGHRGHHHGHPHHGFGPKPHHFGPGHHGFGPKHHEFGPGHHGPDRHFFDHGHHGFGPGPRGPGCHCQKGNPGREPRHHGRGHRGRHGPCNIGFERLVNNRDFEQQCSHVGKEELLSIIEALAFRTPTPPSSQPSAPPATEVATSAPIQANQDKQ